jgi:hypothetical protein
MKAYKQISYACENKIVFGYAGIMSLLSFFILLSPVFAQDDEPMQQGQPKVHYDVKKEYDKDGNLTGYDSAMIYYWSDKGTGIPDFDSLFEQFSQQFDSYNNQWDWSGIQPFPFQPPLQRFHYWNEPDSSAIFPNDSLNFNFHFDDFWSQITPTPFQWNFPFDDSLGLSFYNFDDFSKFFDKEFDGSEHLDDPESLEDFQSQYDQFMEKFQEYQKENQKLIEKYFGNPEQLKENVEPQSEPQNLKPAAAPIDKNKSGTV